MGITDLIKEYGEITGRSPGWEKHMSVADFVEFKKAAAQFIMTDTVPVNKISENEKMASTAYTTHPQPVTQPTVPLESHRKKISTAIPKITPTTKSQQESLDELTIFKSMGAD